MITKQLLSRRVTKGGGIWGMSAPLSLMPNEKIYVNYTI